MSYFDNLMHLESKEISNYIDRIEYNDSSELVNILKVEGVLKLHSYPKN